MATRAAPAKSDQPAPQALRGGAVPGFAAQGGATAGFAQHTLRLPGARGAWTYMLSESRLVCRKGRIVPAPAKAWMEQGFMNNQKGGVGQGMIADLNGRGWVAIPHTRPAVAFGEPTIPADAATTERMSTYLHKVKGVGPDGKPCTRWCDVWERPRGLGTSLVWDRDNDGRDEWLISCLDLVVPDGKLRQVHIDIALQPALRAAYGLLDRATTPRGRRLLLGQLNHIPVEHLPDDLKAALEEFSPKAT